MEELRDLIESFCEDYGYSFYSDYSGRCMFGKTCVGIVCDDTNTALEELEDYLRENECDYADSISSYASTDSMGLQMILYFPRVE